LLQCLGHAEDKTSTGGTHGRRRSSTRRKTVGTIGNSVRSASPRRTHVVLKANCPVGLAGSQQCWARPIYSFPISPSIFQINSIGPNLKLQNTTFMNSKISRLGKLVGKFKWINFPYCSNHCRAIVHVLQLLQYTPGVL
jgi:hypothetical protein